MFEIFNRPLSPHLSIYTGQITSTFSILHRFSAIFMLISLIIFLILLKYWSYNIYILDIDFVDNLYLQNWLFTNISLITLYHFLNGVRHIFWDFGWGLKLLTIKHTAFLNSITMGMYFTLLLIKTLN